jgi:hypothetical protein
VLGEKLKELDSGAASAGVADAWLLEGKEATGLQGRRFMAEEVEPWETTVEGADVLDEASALFGRYLFAPTEVLDTLALWSGYTHVFDLFGVSPLLDMSSPTKRCGKTTGAIIVRHLGQRSLMGRFLGDVTLRYVFRLISVVLADNRLRVPAP